MEPASSDAPLHRPQLDSRVKVIFTFTNPSKPDEPIISAPATTNTALSAIDDEDDYTDSDNAYDLPFPGFRPVVFKHFTQDSQPRYCLLSLITSHYFEKISMFVIIVNCITMGMVILA
jgi:hypothetical protein